MKVLVKYSQEFMGEEISEEYITHVNYDYEINEMYKALYSDPHVISVNIEKLGEEE